MKFIVVYKKLLLLFFLAAFTTTSFAQAKDSSANRGRWTAEGRADKITDKISHKLGLNKEQEKKIYVINEDIVRRMDAVKNNTALTKKDRMTQFKALDSERSQRFKTVFTAAQYKKWNDWEMTKKEHLEQKMEKKRVKKENRDATQQP
ncbi:hypothetical protein ACTJJ0_28625 [Chitinophaga sp. 22321]|uniref:LTXXQ motif family protein n=1 Tax=Chitinophaga hostae TaxID=2831022 RepID=A0ABS5J908_9BACT|nr:hypothetical protein [Chitinophaga hostae]MBS0031691.1 hypothetical protein [Chitinophaga hostae]